MSKAVPVGTIIWQDLTIPDADPVRDFYRQVVGWEVRGEEMGDYADYHMMIPGTDQSVAGICHARGLNAGLANVPAAWLIYIVVASVEESAAACQALGGKVLLQSQAMGGGQFCVIQDPTGAVCALFEMPEEKNIHDA